MPVHTADVADLVEEDADLSELPDIGEDLAGKIETIDRLNEELDDVLNARPWAEIAALFDR